MNAAEAIAWNAFSDLVQNFLVNRTADNSQVIADVLLLSYGALGCRMSIKVYCLGVFPETLGNVSEEHCEFFHQDIQVMEDRFISWM